MEVHLLQYILQKMQFLFTTEQPTMSSINPVYLGAKQGAAGVQISQDSATFCTMQVPELLDITWVFLRLSRRRSRVRASSSPPNNNKDLGFMLRSFFIL
jgi:hypothetical protein